MHGSIEAACSEEPRMPKYEIRHPIKLDGDIHREGHIELEHEAAKPLVHSGSLTHINDDRPPPDRFDQFVAVIESFDKEDGTLWTAKGPDLKALKDAGVDIKAAERDALWTRYQDQAASE